MCFNLFAYALRNVVYGANQLAYVAHFVIVPGNSFYQLLIAYAKHFGLRSIKE